MEVADGANNPARQVRTESQTGRSTAGPIHLNEEQMIKLRGELDIVQGNMRVLSEMLSAQSNGPQPGTSETAINEDLELLTVSIFKDFQTSDQRITYIFF